MPRKMAQLLCIDVSPLWLYGHTSLDDGRFEPEMLTMARAHRRISDLMHMYQDTTHDVPIVVASEHLDRLKLDDLRDKGVLLICGVYGDLCVLKVADELQKRGFEVIILEDACLWSYSPDTVLTGGNELARTRARIECGRALEIFPGLADSDAADWSDALPIM